MSSLREDQVEAAVRFLSNEKVKDRSLEEKQDFLKKKGVTDAEIEEAMKRSSGGSSSGGSSSAAPPVTPQPVPPPVAPAPPPSSQPPQQSFPPPQTTPYGYAPQMQQPPPYGQPYGYGPPPQGMQGTMPPPMMPYDVGMPYDMTQQSQSSGSRWAWGLGGVAAGLGLTTLLANAFTQRTQQKLIEGNAAMMQQQYMYPQGVSHGAFPQPLPNMPPTETVNLQTPGGVGALEDAIKPTAKEAETGTSEVKAKEKSTQEAYEDLLALLQQNSEEVRETSAMFKKAITQQQEQYQTVFTKMQDFLSTQTQQQKVQKSTPTDLSAATLQALASLIEGAKSGDSVERVDGASIGSSAANNVGPANSLRESFDAIALNLNRLLQESPSKGDASKALNTLSLILQNLLKNNGQEKDRKVNTSSARFAPLAKGPQAELLKLAGFEFRDPMFTLPSDHGLEAAERVRDLVVSKQRTLDQDWVDRPAVEPGAENSLPSTAGATVEQKRPDEHGEMPVQPELAKASIAGVANGDGMQGIKSAVPPSTTPNSSHVEPQSQSEPFSGSANPPVPTDGSEGVRRAARPWESSVPKSTIPARPWETAEKTMQAHPGNAISEQTGGDDDEDRRSMQPRTQQFVPPTANVTMAHPAESPESGMSASIAHPAEAEDVPQPQQPPTQPQPPMQPQSSVPTAVQPTDVPAVGHRGEAPTIAHPAERSAVSEEPQSGG